MVLGTDMSVVVTLLDTDTETATQDLTDDHDNRRTTVARRAMAGVR
jgi:hypothetical protein